jgi:hypothetical protein
MKKLMISVRQIKLCFILIFSFQFLFSFSQKNDYIWELGSIGPNKPMGTDTNFFSYTIMDFNYDPVKITFDPKGNRTIDIIGSNSSYSNDEGVLRRLTNRTYVVDGSYDTIEGGEGIFKDFLFDNFYPGSATPPQGVIVLPIPRSKERLWLFSQKYSFSLDNGSALLQCEIDLTENNGNGKLAELDKRIINKRLVMGNLTVTRHGNGIDWWLLLKGHYENELHLYLLEFEGAKYITTFEDFELSKGPFRGQAYFSPDGTKYAIIESRVFEGPIHVNLLDFDRCTGEISVEIRFL